MCFKATTLFDAFMNNYWKENVTCITFTQNLLIVPESCRFLERILFQRNRKLGLHKLNSPMQSSYHQTCPIRKLPMKFLSFGLWMTIANATKGCKINAGAMKNNERKITQIELNIGLSNRLNKEFTPLPG